ncbi:hypothetical protein Q31b_11590 [Novipirellula aureliae]|uniref:Uncharacterized protein n=1 Tax=Novipirellula aureliae TaxID=2527966 RepID=A0A5C6EAF1_9BACT|nr:hypothetical protein [Novipirellula aureliae]TWU45982.1 hypothetical protein Q31b_11590 [Novipirellula aureliae]
MSPPNSPTILYCHCAYAKVIPEDVKSAVLKGLIDSGTDFESVPDLCEMSARRDPVMQQLSELPNLRIAACYKRAVMGLFEAADCSLAKTPSPQGAEPQVVNLRVTNQDDALQQLLAPLDQEGANQ